MLKTIIYFTLILAVVVLGIYFKINSVPDNSIHVGDSLLVTWDKAQIDSEKVQFIFIRKKSSDPFTYDLLGVYGDVLNTGSSTVKILDYLVGNEVYVQVACPSNIDYECRAIEPFGPFTITQP